MIIIMPKLGLTMTHATITEWLKQPGDAVSAEEPLCSYETEKVTLELTAPADGVLGAILAAEGETVPAGAPVCEFTPAERRAAHERPTPSSRPIVATPRARALANQHGIDLREVSGRGPSGRIQAADITEQLRSEPMADEGRVDASKIKATPLARRMAAAEGIDLAGIPGTGSMGTITREDVAQALLARTVSPGEQPARAATSPVDETIIPHTALRRTIAARMTQSATEAPQVTILTEAEATNLVSARTQLNQEVPANGKIAYNTLLVALLARALREHPNLNARWEDDGIHLIDEINIALAVDTDRGLMTPVLHDVDKRDLWAIQRGYHELIQRAMAGRSLPEDFAGGTFTLTNLGALEVDGFTPIINPPQAAILGVGRIVEKPVAREGAVVIRPMITLSLSFDHRIVDGGPAARFLQRIKQLVERPMVLLFRET